MVSGFHRIRKLLRRPQEEADVSGSTRREVGDTSRDSTTTKVTGSDGVQYTESQLLYLRREVEDYQLTHGSLLKTSIFNHGNRATGQGIGVSLLPTSFPRRCFEHAIRLQIDFNVIYTRIASDPSWLCGVLRPLRRHDPFLAALLDIFDVICEAGTVQDVVCGIFRSDYMLHQPQLSVDPILKQVEFNTFSCAGFCHAERVAGMHLHLERVKHEQPSNNLLANRNTQSIVNLLQAAHQTYQPAAPPVSTCVLMIVQPFNFNIADERPVEYGLWDVDIPCFRCEWLDVLEKTTLMEGQRLIFQPSHRAGTAMEANELLEVSVVYYRAGYEAIEYEQDRWQIRLHLEKSRAIKCPDILTHLAGFKSVQAALAAPGVVERFLSPAPGSEASTTTNATSSVLDTFMPIQSLDGSPQGSEAAKAINDAAEIVHYVLKPNLEGGGHNIYGADIPAFLADIPREQWMNYTLMRMIEAPRETTGVLLLPAASNPGHMNRNPLHSFDSEIYDGPAVSELGILGTCMWKRGKAQGDTEREEIEIHWNEAGGWTFKTKLAGVQEMSVVKGYGCFDCPRLV